MTAVVSKSPKTFPASVALPPYARVKLSSGLLVLADAADDELGILEGRVLAGESGAVRFLSESETVRMIASKAIAANADVYRAADGEITDTQAGTEERIGIALEAASGDQSIIEVLPKRLPTLT